MRCPSCNSLDTQVKDSRPTEDSAVIRRRRVCVTCNFRFTTFERVQLRELTVIKRNSRRVPFDRDKLVRSLQVSLRKRPVDPEQVEQMVSAIVRELESGGEGEVSSEVIGETVMEHLRKLDDVAYVRFASVYRNFREAKDFETVLGELSQDDEVRPRRRAQMSVQTFAADERRFMELALALGRRGQGQTWPNPAVGAVIVKDGIIVGRGWTQPGGRPHAEPEALKRASAAAKGATLYVTLEPCSHHGKSPPCADAIIAAGIARVVSSIDDVNPEVAGRGHNRLRAAGITVDVGLCADQAARDHAGHFLRMREQRPHVTLKLALSADGKIAGANNKAVSITGETANARSHLLRAQSDAILVGFGTVSADDPMLTCRLPGLTDRSPVRVVLDSNLRIAMDSRLVKTAREIPLWLVASETADAPAVARLAAAGAHVLRARPNQLGLDPASALHALAEQGITRLLIEGGAMVARSFLEAGLVDEIRLIQGAVTIGDDGIEPLAGMALSTITQSPQWRARDTETLGPDTMTVYERA